MNLLLVHRVHELPNLWLPHMPLPLRGCHCHALLDGREGFSSELACHRRCLICHIGYLAQCHRSMTREKDSWASAMRSCCNCELRRCSSSAGKK